MRKLNIILSCDITNRQHDSIIKHGVKLGDVPEFNFTATRVSGKNKSKHVIYKFEATKAYVE
jgi:hypothetical protein